MFVIVQALGIGLYSTYLWQCPYFLAISFRDYRSSKSDSLALSATNIPMFLSFENNYRRILLTTI